MSRAAPVMPETTPRVKIDAVHALGGEVVLRGESYSDAYQHALALQEEKGMTFVHPFDDPDVIAGQGTIGMEILRQHQGPLDAVFVAIGGGGLVSGVGAYIKAVRPEIRVIGVQMADSDAMLRSVREKDLKLFLDLARAGLLLAPQIPMLWMGEEWSASAPFLFFVDFAPDEELNKAVRDGRRREFKSFAAFADEEKAKTQLALADFYFKTLRYDLSRSECTSLMNRFPNTPDAVDAQFRIGECYLQQKMYVDAAKVFEKMAKSKDKLAASRGEFLLGVLAQQRGDTEDAKARFRNVMDLAPSSDVADGILYRLSELYGQENRFRDELMLLRSIGLIGTWLLFLPGTWGILLSISQRFVSAYPQFFLITAGSLVLVVLAFNLVGDAVRDALDPRTDR